MSITWCNKNMELLRVSFDYGLFKVTQTGIKTQSLINWELCTAVFVSGELLVRDFILFKSETLFAQNDWPFFLTMYVFFIPSNHD